MTSSNDGIKLSSVDSNALLIPGEKNNEDTTTCTCAPSNSSSDGEKASANRSSKQYSNELNVDTATLNEDVESHLAIIGSIDVTEYNHTSTEIENQTISDLPTIITQYNSSAREKNGDEFSDTTMSTFEVDTSLNYHRCIFSNYWEGKHSNVVLPTVLSRSSSYYDSEASTPAVSPTLYANIDNNTNTKGALQLSERSFEELPPPSIPTCYFKPIVPQRQLENRRRTLPRAVALNDERVATNGIIGNAGLSLYPKQHNLLQPHPPHPPHPPQQHPPTASRRKIFNKNYSHDNIRKASSTFVLLQNRKLQQRSCLKPLGRSLSASLTPRNAEMGNEASGRVTFDPNVRVMYETIQVKQACDGWSKQFI